MFDLLLVTCLLPFLGFALLTLGGRRVPVGAATIIGVGSVGLAALVTLWLAVELSAQPAGTAHTEVLWQWVPDRNFAPHFVLRLDGLSLTLLGVINGVGFLIHLFAAWYMRGDPDYARFFSYMNLFITSMLILVLGDNLLLLFFGWEGVGLCSYLLIGFWYRDAANGHAAIKAFVVTRVGDALMAVGLFWLYRDLGTLQIQQVLATAPMHYLAGGPAITAITLLLLGGAVGKSAQLPLQTWLPDAMAGPTPVSALIHAATMVTAGVYLIARMHGLFELAPASLMAVGVVGALTLLLSSFAALAQTDIKRILAYSTISQIGYMFLGLGVGAWGAAIHHLVTHAFFKALLFLTAGAVILACHHEQDIFKLGGLRRRLPLPYACFLVGGLSLAAFPWLTAGFYSKDEILAAAYAGGHAWLAAAGLTGAFLTSVYIFRLIFIVFHGKERHEVHPGSGVAYGLPLVVLLVLSTFIGGLIRPPVAGVLPAGGHVPEGASLTVELISAIAGIGGIGVAALLFLGERRLVSAMVASGPGQALRDLWLHGWGFDWLYDRLFVWPFMTLVRGNARDVVDALVGGVAATMRACNAVLMWTQTGQLRWYAASMALGAIVMISAVLLS
jgi:NADH-quinone oxidoreductase subunit L